MYSREEVFSATLKYFNGDELATNVFFKYCLQDKEGNYLELTPDDMHHRLAKEFARIEAKFGGPNQLSEETIYGYLKDFKYICVSKDTWVLTSNGAKKVGELIGVPFIAVVDGKLYRSSPEGFFKTGQEVVYEIHTKEGFRLKATQEHRILVHESVDYWRKNRKASWKMVKDLSVGDKIVLNNHENVWWPGNGTFKEGWVLGNLVGDGTFSGEFNASLVLQGPEFIEQAEIAHEIVNSSLKNRFDEVFGCRTNDKHVFTLKSIAELAHRYSITSGNKNVTEHVEKAGSDFCRGFISGYFDADGSVNRKGSSYDVRLNSSCLPNLEAVQRMLLRLGIVSRIYKNRKKPGVQKFKDHVSGEIRESLCVANHDLVISRDNFVKFHTTIGFTACKYKEARMVEILESEHRFNAERWFAEVQRVEKLDIEPVYDCTIPGIGAFDANGMYVHNCPQGSPMAGIGNNYQNVSLSNCAVIDPPKDSISDIMNTGRDLANLFKRRFGCGIDLSELRPDGASVSNSARISSGSWSFADYYSNVTKVIGQSGRRGAMMLTMDIRHPDIDKFITMKNDPTKVTGANISVKMRDDFMVAVKNDEDYLLRWPVESNTPRVSRTVRAKDLWALLISSATTRAEPGIMYWDTILNNLPAQCYADVGFNHTSSNPCLTGDTWVLTENGPRQIVDLLKNDFVAVVNGNKYAASAFFKTGNMPVLDLKTNRGYSIRATSNHLISTPTGWKEAGQLRIGEDIVLSNNSGVKWNGPGTLEEGWIVGQVVGDGCFNSNSYSAQMAFWGESAEYMSKIAIERVNTSLAQHLKRGNIGGFYDEKDNKYVVNSTAIDTLCSHYIEQKTKDILPTLEKTSSDFYIGFIRGFFDTDGSPQGNLKKGVSVRLAQANLGKLIVVQRMLSRLGVISTIYENRKLAGVKSLPNGKGGHKDYYCKAMHEIVISRDMYKVFSDVVGFEEPNKTKTMSGVENARIRKPYKTKFVAKIKEIKQLGSEDVYDCSVQDVHMFDANGIIVHNCSELPLSTDSCRLISQNLKHLVENPFTKNAYFDFDKWKKIVSVGQRLSDDLVELEIEKLDNLITVADTEDEKKLFVKFKKSCVDGRRTGLGAHGLADALARLQLKYDTEPALEMVDKIFEVLQVTAYDTSVELAQQRGAFPVWDWEKEKNNAFIKRLPQWLQDKIEKYGRRGISLLTTAPTGSVSIESGTSSGIEPLFRNKYTRRKRRNHGEQSDATDFVDKMGERWKEFEVLHGNVQEWKQLNPDQELPDFFVESDKIDWSKRVEVQAIITSHLDHSVSSTINLPAGTGTEVVSDIYMQAWEQKCKGVTVYVDQCRDNILVSQSKAQSVFNYNNPIERPEALDCDLYNVKVKGEKWTVLVGLLEDKPYEVFCGKSEFIEIPQKFKTGQIFKRKKTSMPSKYDLSFGDDGLIKDIGRVFNNEDFETAGRLISALLRHGAAPSYICEQLGKDKNEGLDSYHRVISRVLKKYIKDGTKAVGDKVCESCGQESLIYQDGCVVCGSCGWSKCG